MSLAGYYTLPKLPYSYQGLKPYISEDQLRLHYEKHHRAYVDSANAFLQKFDKARRENTELDVKSAFKEFTFHIGGHVFHTLFWGNLAPIGIGGGIPTGLVGDLIKCNFGSFDRFKTEFSAAARSVEGSGWATASYCILTNRLYIIQVEKHNVHAYPMFNPVMVLDMFEHAYYLDYKNERGKYIDAFWNLVNWAEINKRIEDFLRAFCQSGNPSMNTSIEYPFS